MLKVLVFSFFIFSACSQELPFSLDKITSLLKPTPIPLTSPLSMFLRHHESVAYREQLHEGLNCTNFNLTDPNNPLMSYLTHSGQSINDFGVFESCKHIRTNDTMMAMSPPLYALFGIALPGYVAKWGVCMPLYCFPEIYGTLSVAVPQYLKAELVVINGNVMDDYDLSDWKSIFMMCILGFFILMGLVGSCFEYTSLGDKRVYDVPLLNPNYPTSEALTNQQSGHNINGTNINGTLYRSHGQGIPPPPAPPAQPPPPIDPYERKQCWAKFFVCFSISHNMKKFVTRGREPSPLDVLDGVRVLSIFWVILGHSYFYPLTVGITVRNTPDFMKFVKQFLFTLVTSGVLAVDTFFFMSAFLGAYIFLVKSPKHFTPLMLLQIPIAYFHRYYRLTPLLAFIIYFAAFVIYPLASGPIGNFTPYLTNNCYHYGWADLLYINNFYPKNNKVCEGQTWYLANDMQMFLILPWLMIFYRINKFIGYSILILCLVANLVASFYISWYYKLGIGTNEPDKFNEHFYQMPWVRATPYLVGILAGILYYEYKQELKRAKQASGNQEYRGSFIFYIFNVATRSIIISLLYSIVGLGITFTCVFVYYPYQKQGFNIDAWGVGARATYNMLARGMFVFGLFLVLIPILAGRMTMLRDFLGNSLFHVMAKSTYSVYLIHEVFLITFGFSQRAYQYFTHLDAIIIALSMIVLSYLVGSVFTLLIDSPLANIDKTFIFPPKKKKTPPSLKTLS